MLTYHPLMLPVVAEDVDLSAPAVEKARPVSPASIEGRAELLSEGSRQQDLWGINLYPDLPEEDWLEFDSMINLRPSFGNRSRAVDDLATRERITEIVRRLVQR